MNEPQTSQDPNPPAIRRPDYIAYSVQESRDGKGHWNRVGAAWRHRDGEGVELQLDSVPVNGRITLREQREERLRGYQEEQQQTMKDPQAAPQRTRNHERSR